MFDFWTIGTFEHIAPWNFLAQPKKYGRTGVKLGHYEDGDDFFVDIFRWKREGTVNSTVISFYGKKDSGKTLSGMIWAARNSFMRAGDSDFRRRVAVNDTRVNKGLPEYYRFAKYLGSDEVDLSGEDHSLNPLDPSMRMSLKEQYQITRSFCEMSANTPMSPAQRHALLVGLELMNLNAKEYASFALLADIMSTLRGEDLKTHLDRRSENVRELIEDADTKEWYDSMIRRGRNYVETDFKAAAFEVGIMLFLVTEEHDGLFAGEGNSLRGILTSHAVILNFNDLGDDTKPFVEMLIWMWRNSAIRRHDHELMAHIELHDENWLDWESLIYARNMTKHLKQVRGSGAQILMLTHRLKDAAGVGSGENPQQRTLARNAHKESDIRFFGQSFKEDIQDFAEQFYITQPYRKAMETLDRGEFVVSMGNDEPFIVQFDAEDAELEMGQTNEATDEMQTERFKDRRELLRERAVEFEERSNALQSV